MTNEGLCEKVRQCPLDDPLSVQRACECVTITWHRWSNRCLMDDANQIYTNNASIDLANAFFTFIPNFFKIIIFVLTLLHILRDALHIYK